MKFDVELPNGTATVSAQWVQASERGTIVVAHGAGAGMDHPFLIGFTDALNAAGFSTLRFNFPYREQGRRMPGPAAHAITAWRAASAHARALAPDVPLWAAGKSYGGRMASMAVAEGMHVDGLIYLGYPLHPSGRPEKPRAEHLPAITVPQLFVEGSNDPFIQPLSQFEQVVATCVDPHVRWIDGGGHSFEVKGNKRPPAEVGASLAPVVSEFAEL
ncbi:alpha/beta hydrolase family protein [Microbacterium murale]|uniref:Alpha/beta-hydrolase family hydrolase n=1 Tax=Microbacterium murale TaxID=1081040 RepID=A0ABU0PD90_9MICO|nr:alpha/beta family hydrolase [Microbacterium murale]MDQ0644982.1 putative alpha/beta-hydrolase family hydrolase [Microbacterium murale]